MRSGPKGGSLALSLFVGAAWFAVSTPAVASCIAISLREQYAAADLVAIGAVTTIGDSPAGGYDSAVAVEKVFKGRDDATIIIHDSDGPVTTSVDVGFTRGERFLLFLTSENGGNRYTTDVCMGSRVLGSGSITEAEQQAFGGGTDAGNTFTTKGTDGARPIQIAIAFFLTVIVPFAAIYLFLRFRRHR